VVEVEDVDPIGVGDIQPVAGDGRTAGVKQDRPGGPRVESDGRILVRRESEALIEP